MPMRTRSNQPNMKLGIPYGLKLKNRKLHMKTLKPILLILLCGILTKSYAWNKDSLLKRQHFEVSFGQSLLFISNSKQVNIRNQAAVVIPTNAMLFFVEFRPQKNVRVPVFLNLATETKQFVVNGQIINERAAPTFGAGITYKVFQIKIDSTSKIEFEAGPLASVLFNRNNDLRVAPIIAGRFRIMRGANFVMYAGVSYSIGINALGLLYGTGTVF